MINQLQRALVLGSLGATGLMIVQPFAQITRCAGVVLAILAKKNIHPGCFRNRRNRMTRQKHENGGGGWIRTIELIEGRFTVCCGWPLRYPTGDFSDSRVMVERKGFEPSTPTLRT